jgi:heat shock protein HslJ
LTPVPGAEPTAFFGTDNTVSGSTGCNDYSGAYRTEPGNKLTVSGIVKTLAACTTENLTRQDDAFTILMQSSVNYLVAGDQLSIVTVDGGVMNFTLVPSVGPTGPTAVINSPDGANVGDIVNFDGSGSQAGTSPIVSYNWDFGDGGLGTGSIVQYAYQSAGTYNVSLTVVDELGLSNTAVKPITINAVADTPPTAAITGPAAVVVNQQATYSAANSTAGSSPITRYIWNFGNGNTFETTEPTAITVFQTSGVFWVNVTVVDANGLSGSAGMQTTANASVAGVEWVLANTIPGTSITLQFTNELISGFGGCNTYNASIVIEDPNAGAYRLGPINSTSMACSTEISTQEQNYFAVLGATTRLSINGSQLTLTAPDGRSLLYNGRPLATPYQ